MKHNLGNRTAIGVVVAVAVVMLMIAPLVLRAQGQGSAFKVGVLPFVDNTGTNATDLANSVSRSVQAEMVHSTQLQSSVLTLAPGVNPNSIDADKAVGIGRTQNVDVVVVGTVLEAHAESSSSSGSTPSFRGFSLGGTKQTMKATVTLQADLYSTTTGQKIDSIRVSGDQSQTKIAADTSTDLGNIGTGGANFDNSTIGKAFHKAVSDLVKKINTEQAQMAHYAGGSSASTAATVAASDVGPGAGAGAGGGTGAGSSATTGAGTAVGAQPELKSVKIDFVPGERTVFFDDFSDMAEDEPPPHWKARGAAVELRTGGNIREIYASQQADLTTPSFALPPNFTVEMTWTGAGEMLWFFRDKNDKDVLHGLVAGTENGEHASARFQTTETLGEGQVATTPNQPVRFDMWIQQGRLRAYINGVRLLDVNQVQLGPIDHFNVEMGRYHPNGIRSVRIAESAPDFSSVINSTGKYVTHGIYFDTDSDRLNPESAPVIKQVSAALDKNPNLKLEIDGYTDSVGDQNHNLDLSKRRAQAVLSVLVGQFGVDASRLSANGLGPANPIGSNDTPDGRAANRRVEFVKK